MNYKFILLIITLSCLLFSCNENGNTANGTSDESKISQNSPSKGDMVKPTPNQMNADGTKRKAWAIVTADIWHYKFALTVNETPKENIFEGYWIDFEDDFTFVKGKYNDTLSIGEYNFDFDSKILEIIPTAGDEGRSEYRIQTNGEIIILIGTAKYGNNSTQIKLKRERKIPILNAE